MKAPANSARISAPNSLTALSTALSLKARVIPAITPPVTSPARAPLGPPAKNPRAAPPSAPCATSIAILETDFSTGAETSCRIDETSFIISSLDFSIPIFMPKNLL